MYWGQFAPYVSVAEKKKKAEAAAGKLLKSGKKISPIRITGRKIADSFWGKAWCSHLESFSDYENRLPRGRSYVRHGAVVDLQVEKGAVKAMVHGSSLYKITIDIATLSRDKWQALKKKCAGEIGSVIELLQGKLSGGVMKTVTDKHHGLFPHPNEIRLQCSCPDWADMCKHVAAAMYGIGARLDREPELLFLLRNVDHLELIDGAAMLPGKSKPAGVKGLEGEDLSVLFGIDLEDISEKQQPATKPAKSKKKPAAILGLRKSVRRKSSATAEPTLKKKARPKISSTRKNSKMPPKKKAKKLMAII
jgi:uncharacterized Zn finger protein